MVVPLWPRSLQRRREQSARAVEPRVVIVNWKDRSHPEAGGAETYCENIADELVRSGARVTLLAGSAAGLPAREVRDGVEVRRLGRTLTVYPLALAWMWRHRHEIDGVLDSQNGFPFFSPLAVGRRTPVALLIHHVHQDQFAMYFPAPVAWVGRFLESTATRVVYGTRAVCAVSPSTRSEVRRRLRLRGPVFVTPNGVTPPTARVERAAAPTIACVGRLTTHKRWDLLVRALPDVLAAVPELTVDMVGTGPDHDALVDLAAGLGIADRVRFHGWVTTAERDEILGCSWLTVSTSVGEGWGLSIVEAASHGVPAVAFDVPGLRDSVRDGLTGWLTTEDGLGAQLQSSVALLADPAVAATTARACEAWATSLRWSATADRIRTIFASERDRLRGVGERAGTAADMACLVRLDREAAARVDRWDLDLLDQTNFCHECLHTVDQPVVFLAASDERGAAQVMARLGFDADDELDYRIARPSDLVQWPAGARLHVHPSVPQGGCPADDQASRVVSRTVVALAAEARSA